ncbi:hypothetical protein Pelo_5716 [Pelomyxa schiedti]|nr:hypothetical protein Pelo_5716 [Pelomyxa schiedti]
MFFRNLLHRHQHQPPAPPPTPTPTATTAAAVTATTPPATAAAAATATTAAPTVLPPPPAAVSARVETKVCHHECTRRNVSWCCPCDDHRPVMSAYPIYDGSGMLVGRTSNRAYDYCSFCKKRYIPPTPTPELFVPKKCEHSWCMIKSTPLCCACADQRPSTGSYPIYVDGVGHTVTSDRAIHYCPACKSKSPHVPPSVRYAPPVATRVPPPTTKNSSLHESEWYCPHSPFPTDCRLCDSASLEKRHAKQAAATMPTPAESIPTSSEFESSTTASSFAVVDIQPAVSTPQSPFFFTHAPRIKELTAMGFTLSSINQVLTNHEDEWNPKRGPLDMQMLINDLLDLQTRSQQPDTQTQTTETSQPQTAPLPQQTHSETAAPKQTQAESLAQAQPPQIQQPQVTIVAPQTVTTTQTTTLSQQPTSTQPPPNVTPTTPLTTQSPPFVTQSSAAPSATNSQPSENCIVCFVNQVNSVLVPCGHLSLCHSCATHITETSHHCPVCRALILMAVQTFRS